MRWRLRRVLVRGPSMVPTLRDGEVVLAWLYAESGPRRMPRPGRIVLVELPDRPLSVKRVVAARPGGAVHVEGDNPYGSTDSRQLGGLSLPAITGIVLMRLSPRLGKVGVKRN